MATLTISLTDDQFLDYTKLDSANFDLINAPVGLGIESVFPASQNYLVRLALVYTGIDFDTDILDFSVNIDASVLKQTETPFLNTSDLSITAYIEQPVGAPDPERGNDGNQS